MSSTSIEEVKEQLTSGPEILSSRLGWFGRLDTAIYNLEIVVIVFALIAMSVAVFLDVVAQFVVRSVADLSGASDAAASSDLAAVAVTLAFVAMMAFAGAGEALRRRGDGSSEGSPKNLLLYQCAITAGVVLFCLGIGWGIVNLESSTVYRILSLALFGVAGKYFYDRKEFKRLAALTIIGALGLIMMGGLPTGYSWAQSYGLVLLLWVGFLGASVAARERRHLRVDLTRKLLPAKWLPHFNALSYLTAALFTGLVFYLGFIYLFGIDSSYMRPIWDPPGWLPAALQESMKVYPLPDDASIIRRVMQVVFVPTSPGEIPDWFKVAAIPVSMLLIMIRFFGHALVFARMAARGEEFNEHGGVH